MPFKKPVQHSWPSDLSAEERASLVKLHHRLGLPSISFPPLAAVHSILPHLIRKLTLVALGCVSVMLITFFTIVRGCPNPQASNTPSAGESAPTPGGARQDAKAPQGDQERIEQERAQQVKASDDKVAQLEAEQETARLEKTERQRIEQEQSQQLKDSVAKAAQLKAEQETASLAEAERWRIEQEQAQQAKDSAAKAAQLKAEQETARLAKAERQRIEQEQAKQSKVSADKAAQLSAEQERIRSQKASRDLAAEIEAKKFHLRFYNATGAHLKLVMTADQVPRVRILQPGKSIAFDFDFRPRTLTYRAEQEGPEKHIEWSTKMVDTTTVLNTYSTSLSPSPKHFVLRLGNHGTEPIVALAIDEKTYSDINIPPDGAMHEVGIFNLPQDTSLTVYTKSRRMKCRNLTLRTDPIDKFTFINLVLK